MLSDNDIKYWNDAGVVIEDPTGVYIERDVRIGRGTVIRMGNSLRGRTVIGENVILDVGNILTDCTIGDGCTLLHSVVSDSSVGSGTSVGPFANVKAKSSIGKNCRIGNFVEIKNSTLGDGTKAAHLAYVGDSTIGAKCNIGCGVIFVNYDGTDKYRTTVGDCVFVGSNSNVIAPVNIGDGAYIAAGSTVDIDLPEKCLCIGRCRAVVKEWRSKYNPK